MQTNQNLVEISLVYKLDEEYKVEKVDAIQKGKYYQLKGIPAFASNVAYDDIIEAELEGSQLFFESLIEESGHSVLHIAILKTISSPNLLSGLILYGVNINYLHNNTYLVIDVPRSVIYSNLKVFLNIEFKLGNIDFKEACISQHHREQ